MELDSLLMTFFRTIPSLSTSYIGIIHVHVLCMYIQVHVHVHMVPVTCILYYSSEVLPDDKEFVVVTEDGEQQEEREGTCIIILCTGTCTTSCVMYCRPCGLVCT